VFFQKSFPYRSSLLLARQLLGREQNANSNAQPRSPGDPRRLLSGPKISWIRTARIGGLTDGKYSKASELPAGDRQPFRGASRSKTPCNCWYVSNDCKTGKDRRRRRKSANDRHPSPQARQQCPPTGSSPQTAAIANSGIQTAKALHAGQKVLLPPVPRQLRQIEPVLPPRRAKRGRGTSASVGTLVYRLVQHHIVESALRRLAKNTFALTIELDCPRSSVQAFSGGNHFSHLPPKASHTKLTRDWADLLPIRRTRTTRHPWTAILLRHRRIPRGHADPSTPRRLRLSRPPRQHDRAKKAGPDGSQHGLLVPRSVTGCGRISQFFAQTSRFNWSRGAKHKTSGGRHSMLPNDYDAPPTRAKIFRATTKPIEQNRKSE